jgi:hypothetical protein
MKLNFIRYRSCVHTGFFISTVLFKLPRLEQFPKYSRLLIISLYCSQEGKINVLIILNSSASEILHNYSYVLYSTILNILAKKYIYMYLLCGIKKPMYGRSLLGPTMCQIMWSGVMCPAPPLHQRQFKPSLLSAFQIDGPGWSTPRRFQSSLMWEQILDNVREHSCLLLQYLVYLVLIATYLFRLIITTTE